MEDGSGPGPLGLRGHPNLPEPGGPVVLLILDGVGTGARDEFDAVALARTPNLDLLRRTGRVASLRAHGTAVGLPSDADIGNSEVGHNIMGAGRVFDQGAKCVDRAIDTGALWDGYWKTLVRRVGSGGGALHLIGLLSDGNVHSHEAHLHALIRRADHDGLGRVYVHPLLDGRDVPDRTALVYLERLETLLSGIRDKGGRDYPHRLRGRPDGGDHDRYEADWSIVARGWSAHRPGARPRAFPAPRPRWSTSARRSPASATQVVPAFTVREPDGGPVATIEDGHGVIFFNFRGDRAIEMSRAFTAGAGFDRFDRGRVPDVSFAGMMLYDGDLGIPEHYLVAPPEIRSTLGEYLAAAGVSPVRLRGDPEVRPRHLLLERQPLGQVRRRPGRVRRDRFRQGTLRAGGRGCARRETADAVNRGRRRGTLPFHPRPNFAGGDMVGHTGNLEATVIALEAIDLAIGRVLPAVAAAGGCLVVTADHGNSEDMVERDKTGAPALRGRKARLPHRPLHQSGAVRDPGLLRAALPACPAPGRWPRQPRRHPAGTPGLCSPRRFRAEPAADDRGRAVTVSGSQVDAAFLHRLTLLHAPE